MSSPNESEAHLRLLIETIKRSLTASQINIDGVPAFLAPGSDKPTSAEHLMEWPRRTRATVRLTEAASFIAYVKRFKEAGTMITGEVNEVAGQFLSIVDYHEPGEGDVNGARWGQHRCALELKATPEWARWMGTNGKPFDQVSFANFLEDNAKNIYVPDTDPTAPDAATMFAVATTLETKTDVEFGSKISLDSGAAKLHFTEVINASAVREAGQISIPKRFYIAVSPFVGTAPYVASVRLRFRVAQGKVSFTYLVDQPHKIVEEVFKGIRERIEKELEIPVWIGQVASIN